jgi:hypothetical protein
MYIITLNTTSFFFADVTSLKGRKILWQDCRNTACPSVKFNGVPYINIGWMVKECHQRPARQKRAKQRNRQKHVNVLWLLFYYLVLLCIFISFTLLAIAFVSSLTIMHTCVYKCHTLFTWYLLFCSNSNIHRDIMQFWF